MTNTDTVTMANVRIHKLSNEDVELFGDTSEDALRDLLRDVEAAVRVYGTDGAYTFADLDRWEIGRDQDEDERQYEIESAVGAWALDVETLARMSVNSDYHAEIERVEILLTFGGPNVWLILNTKDKTVQLKRRWGSSRSDAECFDPSAFKLLSQFVEIFYGIGL